MSNLNISPHIQHNTISSSSGKYKIAFDRFEFYFLSFGFGRNICFMGNKRVINFNDSCLQFLLKALNKHQDIRQNKDMRRENKMGE